MTPKRFTTGLVVAGLALTFFVLQPVSAQTLQADKILVLKSKRELCLFKDGAVVKTYRISLGRRPDGPKTYRGDGRTPEGRYVIDKKNAGSRFHLALHVSYPSAADRARAGRRDPGGNIMIHGLPNRHGPRWNTKQFTDWTAGCIALTNAAIDEIFRAVPPGTPIEIKA